MLKFPISQIITYLHYLHNSDYCLRLGCYVSAILSTGLIQASFVVVNNLQTKKNKNNTSDECQKVQQTKCAYNNQDEDNRLNPVIWKKKKKKNLITISKSLCVIVGRSPIA